MKVITGQNGEKWVLDYYIYMATVASLAAAASSTFNINIEADSNFVLEKMSYFADLAGAVQTDSSRVIPLVNVAITDTGSGRSLQSGDVPINSYGGNGGLPFVLPVSREFKAKSTIKVTFSNYSAASTYLNLSLAFIGYKKFAL